MVQAGAAKWLSISHLRDCSWRPSYHLLAVPFVAVSAETRLHARDSTSVVRSSRSFLLLARFTAQTNTGGDEEHWRRRLRTPCEAKGELKQTRLVWMPQFRISAKLWVGRWRRSLIKHTLAVSAPVQSGTAQAGRRGRDDSSSNDRQLGTETSRSVALPKRMSRRLP